MTSSAPDLSPLLERVSALRADLTQRRPADLAERTGADFEDGEFHLTYFGVSVIVAHPDFVARDARTLALLMPLDQAMLAYYFHTSDGFAASGQWIAFSELPNGRFYAQAFQGYSGQVLLREFGGDSALFEPAAKKVGGERLPFADLSFVFQALPQLPLLVACWLGDEDFPASYRILFDASASHHLITDGCAILGSMLTRKLVAGKLGNR